jgi:porin
MIKTKRTLLFSLCVVAMSSNIWAAEPENQSDQDSAKPESEMISLTKVAPPITRVFDYSGDIWKRSTLFGDGGGTRTDWYDNGFSIDGQITQVYQGVTSGGGIGGNGNGQYNGLGEINAYLDTGKLGWWSGGVLAATVQTSWGTPITGEVGGISPPNMTPMWPTPFDTGTELMEYYITQALPHNIVMIAGRIDATNFLDTNSYANTPETQFFNAALNNDLLWGELLYFSTYGAIFVIPFSESFSMAVAAWTPETEPGDYGGDWSSVGVVVNPIWTYKAGGKAGKVQLTAAYDSSDTAPFENPRYSPNLFTDIISNLPGVESRSDNWLFTLNGEQHLWTPGGDATDYAMGTQDFFNNPPGIGLFYRVGYVPENRSPYNMTAHIGLGGRGLFASRPFDRAGIGLYGMFASDYFKDRSYLLDAVLEDEVGVEAYYNFAITPWFQLSFDVQYINPGISTSTNAWVVGTRLTMRL